MKIIIIPFEITQTFWDPKRDDLIWVLVKSQVEADGDYAARLLFTADGSDPRDPANKNRMTALLDAKELEGSDSGADVIGFVHGLLANRCDFGIPWLAGRQGIKKGDKLDIYLEGLEEHDLPVAPEAN
jgi:hypothetical protein